MAKSNQVDERIECVRVVCQVSTSRHALMQGVQLQVKHLEVYDSLQLFEAHLKECLVLRVHVDPFCLR